MTDLPNDGLCCFCGQPYATPWWAGGNNPEPLVSYDRGRACDDCNDLVVIPARIGRRLPRITVREGVDDAEGADERPGSDETLLEVDDPVVQGGDQRGDGG